MKDESVNPGVVPRGLVTEISHEILLLSRRTAQRIVVTIGGESGCGKTSLAEAIRLELESAGVGTEILHLDDYFKLPPRRNEMRRRIDIASVGIEEVSLELLDSHLEAFTLGQINLVKPLVCIADDTIYDECLWLRNVNIIIAEGSFALLLKNANLRIFFEDTFIDTAERRKLRGREIVDGWISKVLGIEHQIIREHRQFADLIIDSDQKLHRAISYRPATD